MIVILNCIFVSICLSILYKILHKKKPINHINDNNTINAYKKYYIYKDNSVQENYLLINNRDSRIDYITELLGYILVKKTEQFNYIEHIHDNNTCYDFLNTNINLFEEIAIDYLTENYSNIEKNTISDNIVENIIKKAHIKHKDGIDEEVLKLENFKYTLNKKTINKHISSKYNRVIKLLSLLEYNINNNYEISNLIPYFQCSNIKCFTNKTKYNLYNITDENITESIFYKIYEQYKFSLDFTPQDTAFRFWYMRKIEIYYFNVRMSASKLLRIIYEKNNNYGDLLEQIKDCPTSKNNKLSMSIDNLEKYSFLENDININNKEIDINEYFSSISCPDTIPSSCRAFFFLIIGRCLCFKNIDKDILSKINLKNNDKKEFFDINYYYNLFNNLDIETLYYITYIFTSIVNYIHIYPSLHVIDNRLGNTIYITSYINNFMKTKENDF